jgi:hypothetical protein
MATKKTTPDAMKLIVAALQKKNDASYADVRKNAEAKGLTIYPILYGRAQALLGLVPMAARGEGKSKKAAAKRAAKQATPSAAPASGAAPKRGPGRPRKVASSVDSITAVIAALQDGERERDRYRRAIEQIRAIVDGVA